MQNLRSFNWARLLRTSLSFLLWLALLMTTAGAQRAIQKTPLEFYYADNALNKTKALAEKIFARL